MKTLQLTIITLLLILIGYMFYHHKESRTAAVFCSDNASDSFPEPTGVDFNLSLKCLDNKIQPFSIDLKNRYSILSRLSIDKERSAEDNFKIDTIYFSTFQAEQSWGVNIKSIDYERVICDFSNPTQGDNFIDHIFTIELEPSSSPSNDSTPFIRNIDFGLGDSYFVQIQGIEGYKTSYLCGEKIIPPLICQGKIVPGNQ